MKALVFRGINNIQYEDVDEPKIEHPTDAIVQITNCAICGSDLHVYNGNMPLERFPIGTIMGHEFVGIIIELGDEVNNFNIGDKVIVPFRVSCGHCYYCDRNQPSHCLKSSVFGSYNLPGVQADYVRVPYASFNMEKVPEGVSDEAAMFAGDVLATGYMAAEKAQISPGDVVAVIGCGPVGLLAQASAQLFAPKQVIGVDLIKERIEMANRIGSVALYGNEEEIINIVFDQTDGRGADSVIEAVGLKNTLNLALKLVRPGGKLSVVGLPTYGEYPLQLSKHFISRLNIEYGVCYSRNYMKKLLYLLKYKILKPEIIITHHIPLSQGPEAYKMFNDKSDGSIKIVLYPGKQKN